MGRYSPTVIAQPHSPVGAAISGLASGLREREARRRQKRIDDLVAATQEGALFEQGIERDTRPMPSTPGARLQEDSGQIINRANRLPIDVQTEIPGAPEPFQPSDLRMQGPFPSVARRAAPGIPMTVHAGAPNPNAPLYHRLGDTGFRVNEDRTPEARAERTRQSRIAEVQAALASGDENLLGALNPNVTPGVVAHRREEQDRTALEGDLRTARPGDQRAGAVSRNPASVHDYLFSEDERRAGDQRWQRQHAGDVEIEGMRERGAMDRTRVGAAATVAAAGVRGGGAGRVPQNLNEWQQERTAARTAKAALERDRRYRSYQYDREHADPAFVEAYQAAAERERTAQQNVDGLMPRAGGAGGGGSQRQLDWDALPGTAAEKTRQVGPRPSS